MTDFSCCDGGEHKMIDETEPTLEREIRAVINKYSAENDSNTPDFILAEFLIGSLNTFNRAVNARRQWFGEN